MSSAGNVALAGRPFGGIRLDVRRQLVETDRHLLDERFVIALFFDEHVDHRQDKGHVRPRLDRIPLIRLGRRLGEARIEVDQLAPAAVSLDQVDGVGGDEGFGAIGAAHDDEVGIEDIRGRIGAEGSAETLNVGSEAEGGMTNRIRRAVALGQHQEEVLLKALGGDEHRTGAAVFIADLGQVLRHQVEGLLPGGAAPFPFPPFSFANQGVFQAVGVVDGLDPGIAAGTEHVAALHVVGIGVEFVDHPVADPGDDAALVDAHLAAGEDGFIRQLGDLSDFAGFRQGPQDLDLGTYRHSRQGTGGEPQEAAPAQLFVKQARHVDLLFFHAKKRGEADPLPCDADG